jgi:hypothetical protein
VTVMALPSSGRAGMAECHRRSIEGITACLGCKEQQGNDNCGSWIDGFIHDQLSSRGRECHVYLRTHIEVETTFVNDTATGSWW